MSGFRGCANWNIGYSFNNNWLHWLVFNWNVVMSINSDDYFYWWFFVNNFFWNNWIDFIYWSNWAYRFKFECWSINNWNNFQWNIIFFSNFERVYFSIIFWNYRIVNIYVNWSLIYWNVFNIFDFNSLCFILWNWNEIISIHSDYCSNFVYRASLQNWNFFAWDSFDSWSFKIRFRVIVWFRSHCDNFISISGISWLDWDKKILAFTFQIWLFIAFTFQNWLTTTLKIIIKTSAETLTSLSVTIFNARFIVGFKSVGMNERIDVLMQLIIREAVDFAYIDRMHIT